MKRALASGFLLLMTATSSADEPAESAVGPCVESVVIARIDKVGEMLDYNTEDSLVLHLPSYVDIGITRVLWGVAPPATLTIVHQPGHQQGDGLFLLGRHEGRWVMLGFEGRVARDTKGRHVVPFFEAPHEDFVEPRGWIPQDYLNRLRAIRYDPETVAWMGERKQGHPYWVRIEGSFAVAKRGLVLDDVEGLLAKRLSKPCKRDAP